MKLTNSVLLLFFLILFACQPQKSGESLYPDNEISISSKSETAIQQFVEGLKLRSEMHIAFQPLTGFAWLILKPFMPQVSIAIQRPV